MPRYIALLRGVSPMNAKMAALRRCFEDAGFGNVRTLLSSGNVAFDAPETPVLALALQAEAAMAGTLPRSFWTVVRPAQQLQALVQADPFAAFHLPAGMKKIVTFLREPPSRQPALPLEKDGARILAMHGLEILSAYLPEPGNPAFMRLLEKTFGAQITTRTWETTGRCAVA